jgi:hypothetical protein
MHVYNTDVLVYDVLALVRTYVRTYVPWYLFGTYVLPMYTCTTYVHVYKYHYLTSTQVVQRGNTSALSVRRYPYVIVSQLTHQLVCDT